MVYSTYLGGSAGERANSIAVDSLGAAYLTGETNSSSFPITAPAFQTTFGGGGGDAFVTKINANGSALVYSTYLGGSDVDLGQGIVVDSLGSAYITGYTQCFSGNGCASPNFPTTAGSFQPAGLAEGSDAFVTKLNLTGSGLAYSTYLGGSGNELPGGIAVNSTGSAYVTGYTNSFNFPTTAGAFQTTYTGVLDAFVTEFNPAGSGLVYSTYLGGTGVDGGNAIAVDAAGNAYVTGFTDSLNFPTTAGAFQTAFGGGSNGDAFITKINATGTALVDSTYLGGGDDDAGAGISVDASLNPHAYVTGRTLSANFPTTLGAFQTGLAGGEDAFVAKLETAGPTPTPPPMPTPTPQIGPPADKDQCKNGGWQQFNTPRVFKNQGDCIQFVNAGK